MGTRTQNSTQLDSLRVPPIDLYSATSARPTCTIQRESWREGEREGERRREGEREREREREGERERGREGGRERGRDRERERGREGGREREIEILTLMNYVGNAQFWYCKHQRDKGGREKSHPLVVQIKG